jgi:hypothetical protein
MNDTLLFTFVLIATVAAAGPLVRAGLDEQRAKIDR